MSTISEVLVELGRSDEIAVAERLKAAAVSVVDVIDELDVDNAPLSGERVDEFMAMTNESCTAFLEVAFPVIEYARDEALDTLPRALRPIALATATARTDERASRIAVVPALGRIVWALTAFALHCDCLSAIVALDRARVAQPFSDGAVVPVIALSDLRFPRALTGNAGNSYANYYEWLQGQQVLMQHYRLFAADFDAAFPEADLVLAMLTGRDRERIFATGHQRETVRRFVARVQDQSQRAALEALFPGDGSLESRLETAYAATEGDIRRFERGPARLFSDE